MSSQTSTTTTVLPQDYPLISDEENSKMKQVSDPKSLSQITWTYKYDSTSTLTLQTVGSSTSVATETPSQLHSRVSSIESFVSISSETDNLEVATKSKDALGVPSTSHVDTAVKQEIQDKTMQNYKDVAAQESRGMKTKEGIGGYIIQKVRDIALKDTIEEKTLETLAVPVKNLEERGEAEYAAKPIRPTLKSSRASSYFAAKEGETTPRRWRGRLDRNMAANPGSTTHIPRNRYC